MKKALEGGLFRRCNAQEAGLEHTMLLMATTPLALARFQIVHIHHSLVKGAATNTLHWWSGELTANYLAMQVALDFNTERKAGVAFFIVF